MYPQQLAIGTQRWTDAQQPRFLSVSPRSSSLFGTVFFFNQWFDGESPDNYTPLFMPRDHACDKFTCLCKWMCVILVVFIIACLCLILFLPLCEKIQIG